MTAPPTRNSSPCAPERPSSWFKSSNNLRRSAWVSATTSNSVAQSRIEADVPGAERRRRTGQEVEAQALQLRAERGLGQRRDRARPFGNRNCTPCTGVLDHRSNVVGEKG